MPEDNYKSILDGMSDKEIAEGLMEETDFVFDWQKSEQSFLGKYGLYVAVACAAVILLIIVNYLKK